MEIKQTPIEQLTTYLANLKAELTVATEKDQIDIIQHEIGVILEHFNAYLNRIN